MIALLWNYLVELMKNFCVMLNLSDGMNEIIVQHCYVEDEIYDRPWLDMSHQYVPR